MPSHFRASPSFPRSRRQTNVDDICRIISLRAQCSSSFAQNLINAISKCGRNADTFNIIALESACRKNQNGQYCGESLNTGSYVTGNCSGSSCSPGCLNILREANCCLNESSGIYTRYFNACGIPLPSPCESRLQIPTITQDNSCISTQDSDLIQFATVCDNIQPIIDAWDRDDTCKLLSDASRNECASRNGQYCRLELNITISNGDSVGLRSLQEAVNECPSTSTCSLQCNSSLSSVEKTVGCCIQSVNNSVGYTPDFNTVLDSRLWNKCGIPFPSKCSATSKYVIYIFIVTLMANIAFLLSF